MSNRQVFVVSDGTGETAEKMVRAALKQFDERRLSLNVMPEIKSVEALQRLFKAAAKQRAIVVSTLVDQQMRQHAQRLANELETPYVDLIEDLLQTFEVALNLKPVGVPGLLRKTDEAYFKRIEAVEFTVKADDGKEPRMLLQADVILVGVSRTSKTPLSTFLAHKGFKVSNVPLVLDRPISEYLYEVDPNRVFALTIHPDALQGIRRSRLAAMGMFRSLNYDDLDYILAELEYAEAIYRANPKWPIIDVTHRALEETAAIIVSHLSERGLTGPLGEAGQLG